MFFIVKISMYKIRKPLAVWIKICNNKKGGARIQKIRQWIRTGEGII